MIPPLYIWYDYTFPGNINQPIIVNGSDIVIDGNGYTLGPGSGYGFNLTDVSNVTIKNVVVTGWSFGFYLSNSSNNTLSGNTVNNNGNGFCLYSSSNNNTISGNTANNEGNAGFYLVNSMYNTFSDNNASNNLYCGFEISNGTNNNFSGNTANNNPWYGFLLELPGCNNNNLTGNTANNNGDFTTYEHGIGFNLQADCNNNNLTGNIANNNAYRGFCLFNNSNNILLSNTANNNGNSSGYGGAGGWAGFYLESSSNNILSGNIAKNNTNYGFCITPSIYTDYLISSNNNNLTGNTANNTNGVGFCINASSYNNLTDNTAANNGYGFQLNASSTNNDLLGNTALNSTTGGYNWTSDCIDNNFTGSVEANYLRIYVNSSDGLPLPGVQVLVVSNETVWYATPAFGGSGSPTGADGYTPWFAVPYRTFTGNDTMSENNNTATVWYSTLWYTASFSLNPLTEVNMSTSHTINFTVTSWIPTPLLLMLPLLLFSLMPSGISPTIYATLSIAAIAIVAAAVLIYHYRHKIFK